ncbi:mast cell protease 1A-like [Pelodiscus sinensis]|uniref:mast cell protease 1A-like n=1 Tax=Pelodiscus sinensis TaxID=13735 RepID=UPI003F6CA8BC
MALMMQLLVLGLLPWAFLLPPGGWAGEIVGGREAKPHSRPYMAHLDIQVGDDIFNCGGFLVAKNFVLTAAHCRGDSVTVTLGAHNIDKRERSQQVIRARRQIPHPQYNDETINNDIMLLQLAKAAKLNKFVKTIALPESNGRVQPETVCSVAGWGRTIANDSSSGANALREVDMEVIEDSECSEYDDYDTETMMCVGQAQKGKDSAQGDSGGPLVCAGKAQGIVSWGYGTPPSVYTRVSTFLSWIHKNMHRLQTGALPGVST